MGAYRVAHSYHAVYRSSAIAFDADAAVEVDDEVAAWVNRDSPGTLVPADQVGDTPDDTDTEAPDDPEPVAKPAPKPKRGGRRASS